MEWVNEELQLGFVKNKHLFFLKIATKKEKKHLHTWNHKQIKEKQKQKTCRERKCNNIKVSKMLAMAQRTSCPKNDNQHCWRKSKHKAHAPTMMINVVEETKKLKAHWEAC
jgi:hypothetical protein